jgi:dTDP-glucose 4,6-dehydratase
MNIFIIGGTGFISSSLVKKLLINKHQVTLFTRGKSTNHFGNSPNLTLVYGNRDNETSIRNAVEGKTFDVVLDMIAYLPEQSESAFRVFNKKTGRFIHCSTISVYMVSYDVKIPITEDQDHFPVMEYFPRNPFGMDYGLSKRQCEDILWKNHDIKSFPVTMLRPTFVSGPGDPAKRDFFWIERMLDGQPLLIPGTGEHKFQQVFVEDVAEAFSKVIEIDKTIGQAYNVAAEEVFTLNEYLYVLSELLNKKPDIHHINQTKFDSLDISYSDKGDVFPFNTRRDAVFSLEKIKQDINYHSTPFNLWMQKTIDWFVNNYKGHSTGYKDREEEIALIMKKVK